MLEYCLVTFYLASTKVSLPETFEQIKTYSTLADCDQKSKYLNAQAAGKYTTACYAQPKRNGYSCTGRDVKKQEASNDR